MPRTSAALLMYGIKDVREETGIKPTGPFIPLDPIKSNAFTIEWPPKSGRQTEFLRATGRNSSICRRQAGRSMRNRKR